jgi:hypothetical protein
MRRYLFFMMFALGACAPHQGVIASTDNWTGFAQIVTTEHEVFRDAKAIMTVRPVSIARDGQRAFGILTNIRRRVPNGPILNRIYSADVGLDYQRHDRLKTHCIDGCQRAEIGDQHDRSRLSTGCPHRFAIAGVRASWPLRGHDSGVAVSTGTGRHFQDPS